MKHRCTQEQFEKDIAKHHLTIEHDSGVHRCLLFKKPNDSDQHFRITTWPGHLAISGDMGDYMFCRTHDMFEFFRGDGINPGYWSEKVQAESVFGGGVREFSEERFREEVRDWVLMQLDDTPHDQVSQVADAVLSEIGEVNDEGEAIRKAMDLDTGAIELPEEIAFDEDDHPTGINPADLDFTDFWETPVTEYTYHYLWCLYAIVWGIQQYVHDREAVA